MPILKNWARLNDLLGSGEDDQLLGNKLAGEVYEDSRFSDGELIFTSRVKEILIGLDGLTAITNSGTVYRLKWVDRLTTKEELKR